MGISIGALGAFAISVVTVVASLAYARRHGLLDQPGQRRSHTQPTPRGGGIGIVVGVLACAMPAFALPQGGWPPMVVIVLACALAMVAAVGWLDDHAAMPALPRFLVHLFAAALVGAALLLPTAVFQPTVWLWLLVLIPLLAGSINAHNFMDGIDALLALQALFVFSGDAWLAHVALQPALVTACLASAAACTGFLLFNWPPARIFMGDVGSGMLGLLIAILAGLLVQRAPELLWAALILPSAFLTDAALTLLSRLLAGRRWYTAHREHLYQWMTRARGSHAKTDCGYVSWNLIVVAPAMWAAVRHPEHGLVFCVAVYALGAVVWFCGKRACLSRTRRSNRAVA